MKSEQYSELITCIKSNYDIPLINMNGEKIGIALSLKDNIKVAYIYDEQLYLYNLDTASKITVDDGLTLLLTYLVEKMNRKAVK